MILRSATSSVAQSAGEVGRRAGGPARQMTTASDKAKPARDRVA